VPRIDQLWHGNLQEDSRAMVILLQVGSVEPEGHEVTFHGHFQGPNVDQRKNPPKQDNPDHYQYPSRLVHPLSRDQ
jgi:hypothetical protein